MTFHNVTAKRRRFKMGTGILLPPRFPGSAVISPAEFNALTAEGYTRIPLVRELLSDLDTPLSVYLKLADGPNAYLFESVQGGETWARYSIIGLPAKRVFTLRGHQLSIEDCGEVTSRRHTARHARSAV